MGRLTLPELEQVAAALVPVVEGGGPPVELGRDFQYGHDLHSISHKHFR